METALQYIKHHPFIGHLIAYTIILIGLGLIVVNQKGLSTDTRDLGCSMARLISYVPAVQFEGESKENFVGWVLARHDMLNQSEECSKETRQALKTRVQLDKRVLEDLNIDINDYYKPSE
jgi:hypothetical protein